jgi:hypothetical protein
MNLVKRFDFILIRLSSILAAIVFCGIGQVLYAQNVKLLPRLMEKAGIFGDILSHPELYEVQIIYTEINRNGKNEPKFKDYHYDVNNDLYFYPSTAVDLPASVLTLEKINDMAREKTDIKRDTYVQIYASNKGQTLVLNDRTSESGKASYSHYIKKMLLTRDKDAYNSAYEFLGQQYFNERMHQLGYRNSWFLHRLNEDETPETARHTNQITFFRDDQITYYKDMVYLKYWPATVPFTPVYTQPAVYNPVDYYAGRPKIFKGNANANGMDFSFKNRMPLTDIHKFLKSIIFPQTQKIKLNLKNDDYLFLYEYMSKYPKDSKFPQYGKTEYPDNYTKYMANEGGIPDYIKIYNISGHDFGYMIDNAYYIDTQNKVEFLLTVVMKCNKTEIFTTNHYEYEIVGRKFISNLADMIYKHELARHKRNLPDFSALGN